MKIKKDEHIKMNDILTQRSSTGSLMLDGHLLLKTKERLKKIASIQKKKGLKRIINHKYLKTSTENCWARDPSSCFEFVLLFGRSPPFFSAFAQGHHILSFSPGP